MPCPLARLAVVHIGAGSARVQRLTPRHRAYGRPAIRKISPRHDRASLASKTQTTFTGAPAQCRDADVRASIPAVISAPDGAER
ncbi:hypothetical protein SPHINGO391_500117 [Sphingomonas aurantiaca]|uniref:Uncharacterized protein n=1 Tax=Sphingomonas aurantiaca TaxID=185949 RepID=A0A5E8AAE5_9SPHN|nr:hypothetical protein SPHINGO391_500117 [Sphingomonas aurantiaca]